MTTRNSAEIATAKNVGDIKTTIKRNAYGEWVVRLFENGELVADYHTNDRADADETATAMLKEATAKRRTVWAVYYDTPRAFGIVREVSPIDATEPREGHCQYVYDYDTAEEAFAHLDLLEKEADA